MRRDCLLHGVNKGVEHRSARASRAGLSLLLGPEGRARQQRDAAEVRERGSVPLVVALLAPAGGDVETLVTTVAVVPRVLH